MKIKKKASRVLALLLALTTLFSIFQATVLAATIADGSKNCTVEKKERNHYLKTTAGNAIGASGYKYTTNDGITGVAYCINWGLAQTSKPLEITGKYTASPATIGAFANGYPQRSLADFLQLYSNNYPALVGLTEEEFLYATQVAIWATLGQLGIEGTSFTNGRATISNPAAGTAQQIRVFTAITIILSNADDWTKPLSTGMYISNNEATLDNVVEILGDTTLQHAADFGLHGIEIATIGGTEYFTRTFSIASATSTVPLSSFYWRDALPGQITLNKLVTGTYNQPLSYKIVYQTNLSGESYRTLADNLSTTKNYVLDASPATLGLAANEKVTQVMFVFGTVKAGFSQVEPPHIHGTVASGLANGDSIVNVADVGGLHNGQWIMAASRWLTTVYAKTVVTLPKTGY